MTFLKEIFYLSKLVIVCLAMLSLTDHSCLYRFAVADDPSEIWYANACGPCSAFVALRAMDVIVSFQDVAQGCGWREGRTVSLKQIEMCLHKYSQLNVSSATITVETLQAHLDDGGVAVALADRKSGDIKHVFSIIGREGNFFKVVDFPGPVRLINSAELINQWRGQTILVSHSSVRRFMLEWPFFVLPSIAILACVLTLCRGIVRDRVRSRNAKGSINA